MLIVFVPIVLSFVPSLNEYVTKRGDVEGNAERAGVAKVARLAVDCASEHGGVGLVRRPVFCQVHAYDSCNNRQGHIDNASLILPSVAPLNNPHHSAPQVSEVVPFVVSNEVRYRFHFTTHLPGVYTVALNTSGFGFASAASTLVAVKDVSRGCSTLPGVEATRGTLLAENHIREVSGGTVFDYAAHIAGHVEVHMGNKAAALSLLQAGGMKVSGLPTEGVVYRKDAEGRAAHFPKEVEAKGLFSLRGAGAGVQWCGTQYSG